MNLIQNSAAQFQIVILLVMLYGCGQQMAGVETTNGATVVMRDNSIEGSTPPFSSVYMFDTGYIPYVDNGLGIVTAADNEGYFRLDGIDEKVLNVQIVDRRNNTSVFLPLGEEGKTYRSDLKLSGKLQGTVECNRSGRILVFLPGTGYYVLLKQQGSFNFDNLPSGSYIIHAALLGLSETTGKPVLLSTSAKKEVAVFSDETTALKENVVIP